MRSSAEPARPAGTPPIGDPTTTPGPNTPMPHNADDRVVPFGRRTPRNGRSQRTPQPRHPDPAAGPDNPALWLAQTAEAWFLKRGTTLTAEQTADTYRATLDLVQLMLDGSHAEHLIGPGEHEHLTGMIQGLRDAPDAV
ncbi:hypothetical protein [Streptomyces rubiginosohelvolus]|uniref:hypothetical protein n=1 Tax=Streptomyces rubiginosohelvolus TaxID=67362 RepID=UPI0033FD7D80